MTVQRYSELEEIRQIATAIGLPMQLVAVSWVLHQPAVTSAIVGARQPEQIRERAGAADLQLDLSTIRKLNAATQQVKQILGPNPDMWMTESRFRLEGKTHAIPPPWKNRCTSLGLVPWRDEFWRLLPPEAEARQILGTALDDGINFIDTANKYNQGESERILGCWFQSTNHRNDVILATKCFRPVGGSPNDQGASRSHILKACEDSLRRLQTDHLDLYQLHRPDFKIP